MPHPSRAESSYAFCNYCGYPPPARWRVRAHSVCARCGLGYMVQTTPDAVPGSAEPFVIVDERLKVQAVSLQAEEVLMVVGSEGCGEPLARYLISDDHADPDGVQARLRITRAVEGGVARGKLRLRTASAPELRFRARVSSCGPPPGALIALTPVAGHDEEFAGFGRLAESGRHEVAAAFSRRAPGTTRRRRPV